MAAMEKLIFTQNPVELAKLTGSHYSTDFLIINISIPVW